MSAPARLIEMVVLSAVIASIVSTLHCDHARQTGHTGLLNTLDQTYRRRLAVASAIAEGRPSHNFASMYTRRVRDTLAVAVCATPRSHRFNI